MSGGSRGQTLAQRRREGSYIRRSEEAKRLRTRLENAYDSPRRIFSIVQEEARKHAGNGAWWLADTESAPGGQGCVAVWWRVNSDGRVEKRVNRDAAPHQVKFVNERFGRSLVGGYSGRRYHAVNAIEAAMDAVDGGKGPWR